MNTKTKGLKTSSVSLKAVFIRAFIVLFFLMAAWSFATPLMASPDEPVGVAKAAAVVRGQLTGHPVGGSHSPNGIIKIPDAYATKLGYVTGCYQDDADAPASCASLPQTSSKTVSETIYNSRYQPLYYGLVGLPSLLVKSLGGIYLMRLVSAALSAIFIALAIMAVVKWSKSRLMLAGILAAATPSLLFFGGVVNPVGFEASVAICFWTCLLVLLTERINDKPKGLVALTAFSGGLESLVRNISPFWVLITLVIAVVLVNRRQLGGLLRNRRIQIGALLAAICSVAATAWIVIFKATNLMAVGVGVKSSDGFLAILKDALLRTTLYYKEMISFFGFLNISSPKFIYILWTAILCLLCGLALYYGSWRSRLSLGALIAATVLIPALISTSQAHRLGLVWQGSDSLPLFVGIPILATAVIASSPLKISRFVHGAISSVTAILAGSASIAAFLFELRRYAVGADGSKLFIFHPQWQPPLGVVGVVMLEVLAVTGLVVLITALNNPPRRRAKSNVTKWLYELRDSYLGI